MSQKTEYFEILFPTSVFSILEPSQIIVPGSNASVQKVNSLVNGTLNQLSSNSVRSGDKIDRFEIIARITPITPWHQAEPGATERMAGSLARLFPSLAEIDADEIIRIADGDEVSGLLNDDRDSPSG